MLTTNTRIHDLLEATGLLEERQLKNLLAEARENGTAICATILKGSELKEEKLLEKLAETMALPFQRLKEVEVENGVLEMLPTKAIFQYNVIPLAHEEGCLKVATSDPFIHGLVDALRLAAECRIRLVICPSEDISTAAKKFYGVGAETLDRMMQDGAIDLEDDDNLLKQDLSELDQEASVVKFVNQIIWEAYNDRATDIHIEPMEMDLRIRYRVDGVLHETPMPPQLKRFQSSVISRIKVMANMDIAEKRLPQDGRISVRIRGAEIDVRVSTMPTVYGESVSLRLLMRGGGLVTMADLGLNDHDSAILKKMITRPHGILLVTGPTGSGKSTSLYAWLHTINSVDKRIMSAEDPIEYEMAGVNQVQMRPEIGLTFANTLRTFLRQDPDVIMVGEIRDKETAEISIRAALTGHLVFSTIHTNDSASTITRLLDMGIEPFLVASSVEGIVAQRLVRGLCKACRQPVELDEAFLKEHNFPIERLANEGPIYEAVGCDECRGNGYKGRTGIFEILHVTDEIRPLVIAHASAAEIKNRALEHCNMKTLRDDGWDKVLAGTTTIDEILRVTEDDDYDEE
ncbi:Type II secretion system protein E [Pontiella desulfatans]|uniref:Type II secretion system protein E n=1 Tax=Pontiella desulfatans TaxID=2750659 RepID=A0A6C2U9W7_PONDE|nr:GspE/PulE family protein [Pontiella desulfatans]VGO16517.1 Type II secretion system protein E [Pontiella desulfatans]